MSAPTTIEPAPDVAVRPTPAPRTVVNSWAPETRPQRRRSTSSFRATDAYALLGALVAALSLTGLVFQRVLPFDGLIGFVLVGYAVFLVLYALLVSFDERGPVVRDRIAAVVVHSLAFLMLSTLVLVVAFTLTRGVTAMRRLNFYTEDMTSAGPLDPLSMGGVKHAVVGTLIMITIALVITIPLGITCALFLTEVPGRLSRLVRTIAEAMTALPSIVAGLFIYATFVLILGLEKSGLAASLAISVMMLPIIIRASDVVLRLVPGNLKEASLAMGAGQWRTAWHVTLPTARSGLATSVILGTARGIGETAPVLLTAGFTAAYNADPTRDPMVSLPLVVFDFIKSPEPAHVARGFGAAGVLMVLVLVLFVIARVIGGHGPGQLTKRARRRAVRRSAADLARFDALEAARATAATTTGAVGTTSPTTEPNSPTEQP